MEMGTMEMHSWGVRSPRTIDSFLDPLCDGLNATCFSLLCVGSFSTIYNKQQSCMKDIRNLLTFFEEINERLVVIWMLLMHRALQRKSFCVLFPLHSRIFIYT